MFLLINIDLMLPFAVDFFLSVDILLYDLHFVFVTK